MATDLVIINPRASHGIRGGHAIYGDLGKDLIAVEPPQWTRILAGYVRDRGFSVKIVDAEAMDYEPAQAVEDAFSEAPRLICLCVFGHQPSSATQQMVGAGQTAAIIKQRTPYTPVIMVGGHVAALPERTLQEEAIDYACNGEGPVTLVGLLELLKNLKGREEDIPGLVFRMQSDRIKVNARAPFPDMKDLHGNAWDLLPMEKYVSHNWQCFGDLSKRRPYASIFTSLNCPYKCTFCCISAPFGDNRYRMRDPKDVVAEVVMLWKTYGVKTIKITDEMFVLNPRHYLAIADGLVLEKNLGNLPDDLNIWAYARIDTVKPDNLARLKAAGVQWLALGIESGSKHVRDGADKALKSEDILGTVQAIQDAGINVIGNYIFGLPDDSVQSMQDTLDLSLQLNTDFANFYSAMAYPGSRLYEEAVSLGKSLPQSWAGYSQHNEWCRPLDTEHVSAKEVLQFRDDAFQTYFTNPAYLEMVELKFGPGTLEHVHEMTKYKLTRKLLTGEIT